MGERVTEFQTIDRHDALLVVVSKEMSVVKFETRSAAVILTKADANRLARFILDEATP